MQMLLSACNKNKEHIAPAVLDKDSVSMMVTYGTSTLISDSGIMKYRIVAEEWEVNTVRVPSRWIFNKGIFMEQFDSRFHIEAYVQADTAFYYDQNRLWELRGNVRVRTTDGLRFMSEELFWDQQKREFYSNLFSKVITPERTLQGSFESEDFEKKDENNTTATNDSASVMQPKRPPTTPTKKSPVQDNS